MKTKQADLQIIDETADLLFIDKPPHLLVHPTKPNGPITLWDRLKELLVYETVTGGQISLINRLDRETSGLMLIAKNYAAARRCSMAMEQGAIHKEYLALVSGWLEKKEQTIDLPLLRLGEVAPSKIWLKRAIHPNGSPAITHVLLEKQLLHPKQGALSLVRCFPKTGRTHQIRVHLAWLGHPIIGDKIYGPSEECYLEFIQTGWTSSLEKRLWLPRQALHSASLAFLSPSLLPTPILPSPFLTSEKLLRWEAPLAKDLTTILQECESVSF